MAEWREVEEPKIWVSRFISSVDRADFDWEVLDGAGQGEVAFINAVTRDWSLVAPENRPAKAYFDGDRKIPARIKDAFLIRNIPTISPALRDVLLQFDLGQTQFFELPIHADAHGTPSGIPNHYMLNVHAPKDTLLVEQSHKVELPIVLGTNASYPGAKYYEGFGDAFIAAKATAAAGADLWHDPKLSDRYFLSDRLKRAIDAADLKTRALKLSPARVFEPA